MWTGRSWIQRRQGEKLSRFLVFILRLLLIFLYSWPLLRLSPKLLTELIYFSNESGSSEMAPATSPRSYQMRDGGCFSTKLQRFTRSVMKIKAHITLCAHTGLVTSPKHKHTAAFKNANHTLLQHNGCQFWTRTVILQCLYCFWWLRLWCYQTGFHQCFLQGKSSLP